MPQQNDIIKKGVIAWIRKYKLLDRQEEVVVLGMARKMAQRVFPKKTNGLFWVNFFKAWVVIYVLDYFYDTLGIDSVRIHKNDRFNFFISKNTKISMRDKKRIRGLSVAVRSIASHYDKKQKKRIYAFIEKMLKAMEYENNIQNLQKQPSFSQYLKKTKESIGSKLLLGIAYINYSLNYGKNLQKLDDSCARLARLTNDLVSFLKEKQENKKNAIELLITNGASENEAKNYIKKQIKYGQKNIEKILKKLPKHSVLKFIINNFIKWLLNVYGKGAKS